MNKIKGRVNVDDDFSPWQQSFIDLYKSIEVSRKRLIEPQLSTLQNIKQLSQKKTRQKPQMRRTFLTLSKINLHSNTNCPQQIPNTESRRYLGPRVTFYSKMNPRMKNQQNSIFDMSQQSVKNSIMAKKPITGRLMRDESIKYLQIIDQIDQKKHGAGQQYLLPKLNNMARMSIVRTRKTDEQHQYIRRLKMIYNSRKQ